MSSKSQNEQARKLVGEAMASTAEARVRDHAEDAAQAEASWKNRALNAEDAIKNAHQEIITQRGQIGQLLGRVRDLEHDLLGDAVQRVMTENTILKQKIRQLTTENRTLDERLKAARSNARFADKRIAELEAQLLS